MKKENFHRRTAAFLLSFGLVLSQIPAYATVGGEAIANEQENQLVAQAGGVKVRATKEDTPSANNSVLSGHVGTVEGLSRDILHDEISLERFNLNFRSNSAKQGRWKGWRFFVGQEGNLLCTEGALITAVSVRFGHIRNLDAIEHTSRSTEANGGVLPGLCGQGLALGADLLEFGINEYHSAEARRNGYGFAQSRDTAIKLVAEIDKNLALRDKLIKQEPVADKEQADLQEMEGKVLADFRDTAIAEFERFHVGTRKTLAQQNSFYLCDAAFAKTFGIIGSAFAMHDILGGGAYAGWDVPTGIFTILSGSFIALDPVISRVYGKAVEKHAKASLEKHGLPTIWENADKLETDYGRMESFCKNHQLRERPDMNTLICRLSAYDANHKYITDELQRNAKALRRGNRTAIQNMGMGTLVGASKVAQGILAVRAGAYIGHTTQRFTLFTVGNLVYLPSISLASLDNIRIQGTNEVRRDKQKAAGTLPGQIIKQRLDELNRIEKTI